MVKVIQSNALKIILGFLILNLIWFVGSKCTTTHLIVNPIDVYRMLPEIWNQSINMHLLASLNRIVIGITLAVFIGLLFTYLLIQNKVSQIIIESFTYIAYPIPKLALLPIVMLLAGIGEATKIIMIVLIIVFQIIINLRDGINKIPQESLLVALSLGINQRQKLRHIILPAITPDLLSTLRIAVGTAISVLFVTETYGTDKGMGYFIVDSWMRINYMEMYAGIVILSLFGFLLFIIIDLLELFTCQWISKLTN
ncbi:MAG: ABC transporter permease subunit [Bacteroidales bacterium]|nr:ABC transporter permease subunit [Bacteroidales bacterium]